MRGAHCVVLDRPANALPRERVCSRPGHPRQLATASALLDRRITWIGKQSNRHRTDRFESPSEPGDRSCIGLPPASGFG
eukprot:6978467-Pyramimonas_sp.AAC.1